MSGPFFSIILPVYNEGERLTRAIRSAQEQTFRDIELLLIDDGSTEQATLDMLAKGAEEERTRLLRKDNGGVSSARNLGIREASGEYLLFLDGDDYLEPDTCEQYREKILACEIKPDLLVTNYVIDDETVGDRKNVRSITEDILYENNSETAVRTIYADGLFNNRGCYRRKHVEETGIRYNEEWAVFEDIDFALNLLFASKTIAAASLAKYHYCAFHKHTDLSLKRFESQIHASTFWLDKLKAEPFEDATRSMLSAMIADQMGAFFLLTNKIPDKDRRKAYETCDVTKEYLSGGSSRSVRMLRCMQIFGTRAALIMLGYLYQLTHRRVVE